MNMHLRPGNLRWPFFSATSVRLSLVMMRLPNGAMKNFEVMNIFMMTKSTTSNATGSEEFHTSLNSATSNATGSEEFHTSLNSSTSNATGGEEFRGHEDFHVHEIDYVKCNWRWR